MFKCLRGWTHEARPRARDGKAGRRPVGALMAGPPSSWTPSELRRWTGRARPAIPATHPRHGAFRPVRSGGARIAVVSAPRLLVLDFDGVVCDGMAEFVETSWRTLAELGGLAPPEARRVELTTRFAALRPIVESGWEMAVLLGLLAERPASEDANLQESAGFNAARDAYVRTHGLEPRRIVALFDDVRVRWIAADESSWLRKHRFYPGVAQWLRRQHADGRLVYVLSTKGKPFLDALMASQGVELPSERVIGKAEPRRDKWDVLMELGKLHGVEGDGLWFVEDRLPTLLELRHHAAGLAEARLYLADWGFIFPDRDPAAARAVGIPVLGLTQMTGPFEGWPT